VSSSKPSSVKQTNMPDGYLPEFEEMYNKNKELKAHLVIPNTNVDYYVPQKAGAEGNSFYLTHNYEQKYFDWGNPFVDYRVTLTKERTSKNIMMYGHGDDRRGLQLSHMKKYRDVNFYKANPVITFDTVYEKSQWKVITMFKENVSKKDCFRFWDFIEASSDEEVTTYLQEVNKRAFFTPAVDVLPSDQLLSIQVCESSDVSIPNRLVLVARKVRPNEDVAVDTSTAKQIKKS
ncbi:MAG: class B sortase, partial [Oscillospiraceae bacterium]